jgi:hypothetical protein
MHSLEGTLVMTNFKSMKAQGPPMLEYEYEYELLYKGH